VHVPLGALCALLDMAACFPAGRALGVVRTPSFAQYAIASIGFDLLLYWGTVGVVHAFAYHRKYRERELIASRLEAQLAQARLQVLRMQIHPHFLFNTLHAISALMHRDVAAAERMLVGLSDLLRSTIDLDGAQETSLREEVDFVSRYLEIMKMRFPDRLEVRMEIDAGSLDARVPAMVLQPLVENAIRHGVAPRASGGRIVIRAGVAGGMLQLEVADDGPGLAGSAAEALARGMGLANTRERLRQLYGERHRFEIESPAPVGDGGNGGERGHAGGNGGGNGARGESGARRGGNGARASSGDGAGPGFTVRIATPLRG
jgi:signal transduction histidine kinase